MFDIFEEREQPKLYIVDISFDVIHRKKTKTKVTTTIRPMKLNNIPILLTNGEMPTENYRKGFFKKIHESVIKSGDFDLLEFRIKSMTNIKFSSKISHYFNYNIH